MKKEGMIILILLLVSIILFVGFVNAQNNTTSNNETGETNETEVNNETENGNETEEEETTCPEIPISRWCVDEETLCPQTTDENGCVVWDCDSCEAESEPPEPDEPPYEVETCAAEIKITFDKNVYYYGDNVKLKVEVFDAQGNALANYPFRNRIFTHGDGLWHTGDSGETNEYGLFVKTDKIEKGKQPIGKLKLKVTTAPNIKACGPVEDIVEIEIKEGENIEEVCGIGVCVPDEKEEVKDIPEDKALYFCSGCELEGKCYPMGYRKAGQYCSENYEFIEQLDGICENSFECKSNVCVSGECVGEGLMKKIIKWFKKMFGDGGDKDDKDYKNDGEEICNKLLIKKDIGDYKFEEFGYGDIKEAQAPLYAENGEQLGTLKCCRAKYSYEEKHGGMAIICPYDSRGDVNNVLKWLSARGEISLGEYKNEELYKIGTPVIVWANKQLLIAVGGGEGPEPELNVALPEEIADAYLKKYNNDLNIDEIPYVPRADEEFLEEVAGLGEITLIDFETLADGTVLQKADRLDGNEWESLGVKFEAPSEEFLKVFGPWHPFNPLDKLSLSPGSGPFEAGGATHDDLNIIFSEPVKAAGIYLLDLGETDERESITFLDSNNNVLYKISPWPRSTFGNPAPGTFVSFISNEIGIAKIEILENAEDGDDVAYDNLYFVK